MERLNDNREDLYDVNGNYVGQGGQGMVTQPGADPSDGGHAQVVKAGVEKLETDAANLQNGVAQVKGALPGWNKGNGGRSSLSGAAAVGRKVADIAQANGNTAPAADAVTAPAPKAQVTQPSGTTQSGGVLSGAVDAGKKLTTIAQQPSKPAPMSAPTPAVGSTAKSPALQELRQKQNAEINAENAKKAEEAVKREEADKSLSPTGTERNDEWSGTRDDAIKAMRQFNGNVDLYNRPVIDAYELTKKGWGNAPKKPGELTATVFSSQYGIKDANGKVREILVTPILQNGTVLSPRELKEYIRGLEGKDILEADDKSLVIGIDVPADGSSGQNLHKMQEAYGGHQPAVTETQLQTERNANPQSSETGNGRDGVTAQKTDADNGGQSVVPAATEVKTESSLNTTKPTVSKEDYDKAQVQLQSDRSKGGIGSLSDKLTVFDYEHPERKEPELPDLEEFTESQPPKLKDIDDSYRTAYAIMEQRMKAAGDDPASKAKRAKARRAQTIVAALGDLLQAAANMWGAAGGATSAKLSSVTAGVGRRHATEDAAELKREAQRAKDLEQMVRRGEKLTAAENKQIMELWKAGENARKYNIGEKNKNLRAKYQSELQAVRAYNAQIARDRHQVQVQHDREVTDLNRHNYRSAEINQRTAGSIKVKRTPPAKASGSGSGKTSGSSKGTPLNKQ